MHFYFSNGQLLRTTLCSTMQCFLKESIEKSNTCNGRTVVVFNISCMQLTGRDLRDRYRNILPHVVLLTKLPHSTSIETNYTYARHTSLSHPTKNIFYQIMLPDNYVTYVLVVSLDIHFIFFRRSFASHYNISAQFRKVLIMVSINICLTKICSCIYIFIYIYIYIQICNN